MSRAQKGKIISPEQRLRLSRALTGRVWPSRRKSKVFTEDQIGEIKSMLQDGVFQWKIAERFGVTQTTISKIKLNKPKYLESVLCVR